MIYGYARVSTDGQTLDAQLDALKAAGADKVFQETALGGDSNRKELAKLMRGLNAGDVLLVTRLDRLARSTRDLLNVLYEVGSRGAAFRSLADAWADTTTPHGVVCGRGRNPTLRLWPTIFSGKIDVFPGDRRSRLISSMTSVAPA